MENLNNTKNNLEDPTSKSIEIICENINETITKMEVNLKKITNKSKEIRVGTAKIDIEEKIRKMGEDLRKFKAVYDQLLLILQEKN